jgi:predicted DNA-binding protein YlxM (UPF0122 family)
MMNHEEGEQEKPRQFKIPWSSDIHFSSPIPGAPSVSWRHGSIPEIIVEMWPDAQDQPLRRLIAHVSGEFKTCVIYHQDRPDIRGVFDLGDSKADRREIIGGRLEWDHLVTRKKLRQAIDLVEEFAKIDQRGRPRGTGRPKRKPNEMVELSADEYLKFERLGLTNKQIRALALWLQSTSQVEIARKFKIKPPAVRRLLERAERKLQKKQPNLSLAEFKRAPEQVGSGLRWNKRPMDRDRSGKPYVRDDRIGN